ncbi:ABC transporter ATP-binding protein [Oceanobacillus damuensis]|uniref:ABC transporter ATP-binding protein n=1 Tax=Oceanobacillus damuensis TaxID=937928 RepID=UPI0008342BC4|nr:ABC transporter ATP-binding protein [Oceanobacillus damuensis]
MPVIEIRDMSVVINEKKLLENITFSLEEGSVLALVGHNGAGKSTLIKAIMGVMEKSAGQISINGNLSQDDSFLDFKRKLSYLPEEPLLLTELTVMQHFQLYGMSYELSDELLHDRIEIWSKGFEIDDKLDEYPESLSKGMRQKVQTICSLLPDTPVLLIDEPFMGLDIYAMDYLEGIIKEKAESGATIILTTHQIEKVKHIADRYIMLRQGRIESEGPIGEFMTIQRRRSE